MDGTVTAIVAGSLSGLALGAVGFIGSVYQVKQKTKDLDESIKELKHGQERDQDRFASSFDKLSEAIVDMKESVSELSSEVKGLKVHNEYIRETVTECKNARAAGKTCTNC